MRRVTRMESFHSVTELVPKGQLDPKNFNDN